MVAVAFRAVPASVAVLELAFSESGLKRQNSPIPASERRNIIPGTPTISKTYYIVRYPTPNKSSAGKRTNGQFANWNAVSCTDGAVF
jgi:hypothetical protein